MNATKILKDSKFVTNILRDWEIVDETENKIHVYNEITQNAEIFEKDKYHTAETKFMYWLISTIRDKSHEIGRMSIQKELKRLINY